MNCLTGIAMLLSLVSTAGSEIIDRVAVSTGNAVITESEITRQIRITALLNDEEPKFTPDQKRETAERLVEQALIRREIAISRSSPASSPKAEEMYRTFRKRYQAPEEYRQTLERYRLTDADVRAAFDWQTTLLEFVEVRFRPAIQIPEAEIQTYYDQQLKPRSTPEATISLEEARPKIEEVLTQERVDSALDRWLGQARTQTRILFREDVFR